MQRRQLLSCLPCLALMAPAWASEGVELPAWSHDLPQARLQGEGDFRWFGLRIYRAQLWVAAPWPEPQRGSEPAPWLAQPFVLQIQYYRAISREQFVDATLEEIERIHGGRYQPEQLARWRAALMAMWQDVQAEDVLSALHQPGTGCRFYARTQVLGELADADFAEAFFSIWLHPNSRDRGLRRQLIGAPA